MAKDKLNKNHVGLALGKFAALLHLVWAVLVGANVGDKVLNFIFPLHFIDNAYSVLPFSIGNAVFLIIMAFIGGYVMGWVFAAIYNWVSKTC